MRYTLDRHWDIWFLFQNFASLEWWIGNEHFTWANMKCYCGKQNRKKDDFLAFLLIGPEKQKGFFPRDCRNAPSSGRFVVLHDASGQFRIQGYVNGTPTELVVLCPLNFYVMVSLEGTQFLSERWTVLKTVGWQKDCYRHCLCMTETRVVVSVLGRRFRLILSGRCSRCPAASSCITTVCLLTQPEGLSCCRNIFASSSELAFYAGACQNSKDREWGLHCTSKNR